MKLLKILITASLFLIEYYKYTLSHLLKNIESISFLKDILLSLNGSEILGDNDDIAQLFFDRVQVIFNDNPMDIFNFAIHNLKKLDFRSNEQLLYNKAKKVLNNQHPRLFRDWLFFKLLNFLIVKINDNSFDFLVDSNWLNINNNRTYSKRLINRMEKEATLALGYYYRYSHLLKGESSLYTQKFVEFVDGFSSSSDYNERRIAFYLIKHSIPHNSIDSRVIEAKLHDSFYRLCRNKNDNSYIVSLKSNLLFCEKQNELIAKLA